MHKHGNTPNNIQMNFISRIFRRKHGVFISYSREDERYILPVIKLIRTMRHDFVFQDTHNIMPGKLWEPQLLQALHKSKVIIIFWCRHSANSTYVKKEYEIAIEKKKDLLPLLLDDTPLTEELAAYQCIDFSRFEIHGDYGSFHSPVFQPGKEAAEKLIAILNKKLNPL